MMWALWKTRNAHVFDDKMVASPTVVAHKMVVLLKQWASMARKKDMPQVEEILAKLLAGLRDV